MPEMTRPIPPSPSLGCSETENGMDTPRKNKGGFKTGDLIIWTHRVFGDIMALILDENTFPDPDFVENNKYEHWVLPCIFFKDGYSPYLSEFSFADSAWVLNKNYKIIRNGEPITKRVFEK